MKKLFEDAKILVVDDVEQVLHSTKNRLEFEFMQVECFKNPLEGLEYLKENKIDVLILDYFMPEMNGDEFVEELRKFNNETIVILQTGYSDKIPPKEMLETINIQGYVDKLRGEEELVTMVKSAIKTADLMKQIRQRDDKIEKLEYRNSIIGDLASELLNDSKNQVFQIAVANETLKQEEKNKEEVKMIDEAVSKIFELYRYINFENEKELTYLEFADITKKLLKVKMLLNNIELKVEIEENVKGIIENPFNLVYLVLKTIILATENDEIMLKIQSNEVVVEVNKTTESINLNKLQKLNEVDEIEIIKEEKKVVFKTKK